MRSIPEKTLEHWASLYASYRYRSFAGLWWPTFGEDIAVGDLPTRGPGKIFNLEMKTTEALSTTQHRAEVRVAQLRKYMSLPVPTYYVFPVPHWHGPIHQSAAGPWLAGTPTSELGFTRAGDLWFGMWTVVIPDYVLYAHLASSKKVSEPVFTVDVSGSSTTIVMEGRFTGLTAPFTSRPAPAPVTPFYGWREFWDAMDACGGSEGLQAVFAVPRGGPATDLSRSQLVAKLKASSDQKHVQMLDYYAPASRSGANGDEQVYTPMPTDTPAVIGESQDRGADEWDAHLTSMFVSAKRITAVNKVVTQSS